MWLGVGSCFERHTVWTDVVSASPRPAMRNTSALTDLCGKFRFGLESRRIFARGVVLLRALTRSVVFTASRYVVCRA